MVLWSPLLLQSPWSWHHRGKAWGQLPDDHLLGRLVLLSWWGEKCWRRLLWWRCTLSNVKCCGRRLSGPAPEPCGKEEFAAHIWSVLKQINEVSASGGGGSLRSTGAWGCFCWRVLRDSSLGLANELLPVKFEGRLWYWSQIVSGLPVFSCFWLGHCGFWLVVRLLVSNELQGQAGHLIWGMC